LIGSLVHQQEKEGYLLECLNQQLYLGGSKNLLKVLQAFRSSPIFFQAFTWNEPENYSDKYSKGGTLFLSLQLSHSL